MARLNIDGKVETRVVAEKRSPGKISRQLWRGLAQFNQQTAGPYRYSRDVLTARSEAGTILGGLILLSWWKESYIELLWLSDRARRHGFGSQLIAEAERRARRRGSRIIHLNTYSFQAPRFYEKLGYRRFGKVSGSPKGASRFYYLKRL